MQENRIAQLALGAWNYLLNPSPEPHLKSAPTPLINDAFDVSLDPDSAGWGSLLASGVISSKYTSEYLIGRIAVGVILMESDGSHDPNQEDWTEEQEQEVINEIVQGLDELAKEGDEVYANITWFYDIHLKVPTKYEPINNRSVPRWNGYNWEFLWINDALEYLGYSKKWRGLYAYANDIRAQFKTDWAFPIFVVNDKIDPDNRFTDGRFAYAYLGKPCVVMTYDNDGWHISKMDEVTKHEACHIFYVLDEYAASGCKCSERSGYLNVENGNCVNNNPNSVPCLMRDGAGSLCYYTRGQVGWWNRGDSDLGLDPNYGRSARIDKVSPG